MAKNIENSKHKPTKSSWKSPFKSESDEKPKKHLRFNLKPECIESNISSTSAVRNDDDHDEEDESTTIATPTKKRKKETKMELPEAVDELEEEIERQMSSKAEKTNLSVMNVRNILRSVITNKYVVDMVRQTVEEGRVTEMPFEPKLTRAKTKELLQQNSAVPPPVVGFLTPVKAAVPEINPEIKLLIDKELSEDSSDEEYNPENEEEEQSDDDDKGDTSVVSDLDSLPPTPASLPAPLTPLQDCSMDEDSVFKVPQENVGQRTRSKLDLNQLPLESLEQAFVPPDITQDMYEQECDNPDWHEFLKEFTQPLAVNETLEDDVDNDPEYNILEDIEGQPVEDKEEMRKDRAVKVTKKELNALISELFECTDIPSSDDETNAQTSESIAALEESIMKETEDRERREAERRGIHPHQRELLGQQLRQHVQLTTQHFLQTYRHPLYHYHSSTCKSMLLTLDGLKKAKVCGQEISNMEAAIDTVACWEKVRSDPDTCEKITRFIKNEMERE
ncbi:B cell differentiation [Homalodisca vitripennis]|nr:B cell differentiation [Homalodisca vitripennis]